MEVGILHVLKEDHEREQVEQLWQLGQLLR